VPKGETALVAAREAGLELNSPCGGQGTCGACQVVFTSKAPTPTEDEKARLGEDELASGVRLACQAKVTADAVISIPAATLHREAKFLLHGIMREVDLAPIVEKVAVTVPEPTLRDQRSDADRLLGALAAAGTKADILPAVLTNLSAALREGAHQVTAVVSNGKVAAVEPGDTSATLYAAAFDIGTTTVVGMLLDLRTGMEVAVAARTNPQVSFGDDVVSRIGFASIGGGLGRLQGAIIECVNDITAELAQSAGIEKRAIYAATFCGNTTMNHLLLGIDPTYVAQAPYVAVVRGAVRVPAAALGIEISAAGEVLTLPNVAGFVGGDTVAVMLAADFAHDKRLRLAVDIGTNGEIVLGHAGRILTASAAAGPAFEGARIRQGMRAAAGAIESVRITDGKLTYETIGGQAAVGLCGTGLIDAVACLLSAGLVDETGRLMMAEDAGCADADLVGRLSSNESGPRFLVARQSEGAARDVYITQRDIRELQLAKAAIAAGIEILLKEFGVTWREIDEVLLAGAFGNYIRKESALAVGLLPPVPEGKINQIGNAAGTGAKLVALDRELLVEAEGLSVGARYVELAGRPDFQQIFAEQMLFARR
jgi:uncharacterized 2Fe-2S/4Fe-4S cluster protein (DUF4445 family)